MTPNMSSLRMISALHTWFATPLSDDAVKEVRKAAVPKTIQKDTLCGMSGQRRGTAEQKNRYHQTSPPIHRLCCNVLCPTLCWKWGKKRWNTLWWNEWTANYGAHRALKLGWVAKLQKNQWWTQGVALSDIVNLTVPDSKKPKLNALQLVVTLSGKWAWHQLRSLYRSAVMSPLILCKQ